MQFTKAIVVLSALAGFTSAAPVAEVDERSSGISLTFTGTNGTSYSVNAPRNWEAIKTNNAMVVAKITINTSLSTCAFIGKNGNFFVDAALFGPNSIKVSPAQTINFIACAGLEAGLGNIIHF